MKEWRLCKEVEATEVKESGETEAEGGINLLTKSTGKIRNVYIAIIRDIHPRFFQMHKRTLAEHPVHLVPANQKV